MLHGGLHLVTRMMTGAADAAAPHLAVVMKTLVDWLTFAAMMTVASVISVISWRIAQQSIAYRSVIESLKTPTSTEVTDSALLNQDLYSLSAGVERLPSAVVVAVFLPPSAEMLQNVLTRLRQDRVNHGAAVRIHVLGDLAIPATVPDDVTVWTVQDVNRFSLTTGIMSVPMTVVLTEANVVVTAAFGLPTDRLVAEGMARIAAGDLTFKTQPPAAAELPLMRPVRNIVSPSAEPVENAQR